ncbi:glycosyltransferase family 2 protein [Shimia sp.]|uniref:glycosyltransferase family 2 protein n=1 Tax=Shimia sp. TaxID=1954381 RepID=UPI003B8B78F0
MKTPYFEVFENRRPSFYPPLSERQRTLWHFWTGASLAAGALYLCWRWAHSLNPEALGFSVLVALAETLFFFGTALVAFDIWDEGDTPKQAPPKNRSQAQLDGTSGPVSVDVFVTTFDEPVSVVGPSIRDAKALRVPDDTRVRIWLLDDGNRVDMAQLAASQSIGYFARATNEGFKAGNLRNGLMHTSGDFVVICDADTRLLPTFLQNTLGYFRDPKVAWVQTPHWFYDLPEGQSWPRWLAQKIGAKPHQLVPQLFGRVCATFTGLQRVGTDPFLADPSVFFDVIQRRRNRNGASFCCGAGSIHRREAVFDGALKRKAAALVRSSKFTSRPPASLLRAHVLEPYRFHVSEDLYTSILLHEDRVADWTSVYHPQTEARMLSPMSMDAWAGQRLKYAGGTFDIALRDNPLWRRGLSWRQKLHYGATFWSYLSVLWAPILLLAPMVSLVTAITPVEAYSVEFFCYFLPAVILGEVAMQTTCKGHAMGPGRVLSVAALPVHLHALACVLRGQRPRFAPTPKLPIAGTGMRHVMPHFIVLIVMGVAGGIGVWRTLEGHVGFSAALLWVNLFWLTCNMMLVARLMAAAAWRLPRLSCTKSIPLEDVHV